jgi:quinol monooxygenase YgiN
VDQSRTEAEEHLVIFIVVKWAVRAEYADDFLSRVADFTRDTRAEPGNIFFEWSRSVDDPTTYYLVEAFRDGTAGDHVGSDHFKKAIAELPDVVAAQPDIVSVGDVPGEGWGKMGEVQPR